MDTFSALSDPTRRNILELLAAYGELTAGDIHNKFNTSPPAISQHLKVLRETKLVKVKKNAQKRIYTIDTKSLQELEHWTNKMYKLWNRRFKRLDKLLEEKKGGVK